MYTDHHELLIDLLADLLANALEALQAQVIAYIVGLINRSPLRPA